MLNKWNSLRIASAKCLSYNNYERVSYRKRSGNGSFSPTFI